MEGHDNRRRKGLAFAALCLLSGSAWMIDQFHSEILSGPSHTAAHMGLLAVLFGLIGLRGGSASLRVHVELAVAGIVLLALPTILATGSGGQVASLTVILISTSIPAVVVFFASQTSASTDDNPLRPLLPALAGLGGAAFLLPFTWPATVGGQAWLAAIVISAIFSAFAAIRLHGLLTQLGVLRALVTLCASAAIASGLFYRLSAPTQDFTRAQLLMELLRCILVEAPVLYLLVYLLRELNPIAISARYLLVPLVTIVESYVIERPHPAWTAYLGALLMAGSAAVLIRTDVALGRAQPNRYT